MAMVRFLINEDGSVFDETELIEIQEQLLELKADNAHIEYRNSNSQAIANCPARRIVIVSGPGTGKSFLFLERIKYWLSQGADRIVVTSFVNKLVEDLEDDLKKLEESQRDKVLVTTLHGLARGILEANHGNREWPYKKNIKMIGQEWKELVWEDVLMFHSEYDPKEYSWKAFEKQLFNREEAPDQAWEKVRTTYWVLTQFYNASGFADMIIRATEALKENPELNKWAYFIIDEYQDFNNAEEGLLIKLAAKARGLLIAGDDDQVLYKELKQGRVDLLKQVYSNKSFVKAMLPFCSRCSYHIANAADAFIESMSNRARINKIFIPCSDAEGCEEIKVVICAHPAGVVDYIRTFISEYREEIEERARALADGRTKDAFLLILAPDRGARFLGDSAGDLQEIVAEYSPEERGLSPKVLELLELHAVAKSPSDNYTLRKALHLRGLSPEECHPLISTALEEKVNIAEIDSEIVKDLLSDSLTVNQAIEEDLTMDERLAKLTRHDTDQETLDFVLQRISKVEKRQQVLEEIEAETDEIEVRKMNPIELMTIVGSKGLSAEHVIVIGCDDINMSFTSVEAFYVALTRARTSLHLITGLKCKGASKEHDYIDSIPEACVLCYKHSKSKGLESLDGMTAYCSYIKAIQYAQKR